MPLAFLFTAGLFPAGLFHAETTHRENFARGPFGQETQLQNNLNGWYDASVGRWLSEDPIGFAAGDGNLYRYVGNATLQIVDPAGSGPRKIVVCVGLTASAGALWGFTAATCAFSFAVGEGAGVVDAAQIAACGLALVGSFATTFSAIEACIEARCDGPAAHLYEIKRDLEWLKAKLNAISVTVGVRL